MRWAEWLRALTRGRSTPGGAPTMQRRAAGAPSDAVATNLPAPLHAMVLTHRADITGGILAALGAGRDECTIGLGEGVDVQLLPDDLVAADVTDVDRQLVVLHVRWTVDGWMLLRDTSNFGVFFATRESPTDWDSVRRHGAVRGLGPGDLLGLGSCPGDSLVCRLPSPPEGVAFAPTPERLEVWALEERLRVAVDHWAYAVLRFDHDDDVEVPLPASAGGCVFRLVRDLDAPTEGWRLQVEREGAGLRWACLDEGTVDLHDGDEVRLRGQGHRLRLGPHLRLPIPPAVAPVPRFDRHHEPSRADIREVFGLSPHDLSDPEKVKAAWKAAARRFHPDKAGNDPGVTSRFVEARTCWEAYRKLKSVDDVADGE